MLHSKREESEGKGCHQSHISFRFWQKHSHSANRVNDQENTERSCVWSSLTVAKHQGPCQNDRNWLPQTTSHVLYAYSTYIDRNCENMYSPLNKQAAAITRHKNISRNNGHAIYSITCDNRNGHTATTVTIQL